MHFFHNGGRICFIMLYPSNFLTVVKRKPTLYNLTINWLILLFFKTDCDAPLNAL